MASAPQHHVLAPGDTLGGYRIVRRLGAGGMGTVFEAVDTTLGRRVALKVIAGERLGHAGVLREAQAQASLDSPHVVPVFAHGEAGGRLYIASQLIPDGDLDAMLRRQGPPPAAQAIDLVAQVADGLAEAHRVGLVHRDIKPANVLLRNRGTHLVAYLADFGIAAPADAGTGPAGRGPVGTPAYLAPELHAGDRADARSDVYSLGCLLWATLTGAAPYAGRGEQVASAHRSAPVPQLPGRTALDREVNRVLRTALAKQASDRYPSAAVMRDDLRALLRSAGRAGPRRLGRLGRLVGRGGGVAATAAVAVVVLVAVALLLVAGGGKAPAPRSQPTPSPVRASGIPDQHPADEAVVVAGLARGLRVHGGLDAASAECTALRLVGERGVDRLVRDGVLDGDLALATGRRGTVAPPVLADVFAAAFGCLWPPSAAPR
ncbi:serine/threonine-protein kinase [Nocardioides sp. SYSU DS0651]|uniref:serine/threonine-protein kinase n=1 Tax=Nocardioides sp. SYSU DS0651 TaxID=3415955 RepID=UPI003F4C54C3